MSEDTGAVRAESVGVEGDAELLAAADLLRAGHDVLLERGRCPLGPADIEGRVCMAFALGEVANDAGLFDTKPHNIARAALAGLDLDTVYLVSVGEIARFNDDPDTTDDDCFDAYTAAEKALRESAARAPVAGRVGGGAEGREEVPRG